MSDNTLKTLFVDELRDLYSSENQLIKAIPKMAKAAESDELRSGFEEHLEQTKEHAKRIERVLSSLGEPVKGKKCKGMEGIVAEGAEVMDEDFEGALMDAALITAAQRVEHYEIAAYGSVVAFAQLLGETDAASALQQTLTEEKETDAKLNKLSKQINQQANDSSSENEDATERENNGRGKASRAAGAR